MRLTTTNLERILFRLITDNIPPLKLPNIGNCGVVSLVCRSDVNMFIIALHSFYYHLDRLIPCTVFEDGSLLKSDIFRLKKHFPGILVIDKLTADNKVQLILSSFPACSTFRRHLNFQYNIKLFDPILLTQYKKMILLDPDILILHTPHEVIRWIADKRHYSMYARHHAYPNNYRPHIDAYSQLLIKMFHERWNAKSDYYLNSGFMCLNRKLYRLSRLETLLWYIQKTGLDATWVPEQCLWATLFAESPTIILSDTYIHLDTPKETEYLRHLFDKTMVHFSYFSKPYYLPTALRLFFSTSRFVRSNRNA